MSQLPGEFETKIVALLEQEAVPATSTGTGDGLGEYVAALVEAAVRIESIGALRGLSLIGTGVSNEARDFVASFGAQSIPHLDEAWALDTLGRHPIVVTWGVMLGQYSQLLPRIDRVTLRRRLLSALEVEEELAFVWAAELGVLPTAAPALHVLREHERVFVSHQAERSLPRVQQQRESLLPTEVHDRLGEWVDAICADAQGAKAERCSTISTLLQNGSADGNALDSLSAEAARGEAEDAFTSVEAALIADNSFFLIASQGLTVERSAIPSADTYIRSGSKNTNLGTDFILRVRPTGDNRAFIRFDDDEIATAVGSGSLVSAQLELTIETNANNWGPDGRTVDVHRMTQAWTELGATWNCANDTDTSDPNPDCPGEEWEMGQQGPNPWATPATATVTITNGLTGVVSFDVTADVQAFLSGTDNYGWIVKRTTTSGAGSVDFHSREGAEPPRLVLEVQF